MNRSAEFRSRLTDSCPLIADGAMGTNLQPRGLPVGTPSDVWNLENPSAVTQLHQEFIAAGSDILLTNTFGSKSLQLSQVGLEDRVRAVNLQAVYLAKAVARPSGAFVAGSIGPTGQLFQPFGSLTQEAAEKAFTEQVQSLVEGGVDLLVVETQFDLAEAQTALRAVRTITDLPLVCSFSFDRGTRTMMGVRPQQVAALVEDLDVDMVGINCGQGLEQNLVALQELRVSTKLPLWFKPNAGLPSTDEQDRTIYTIIPQAMAGHVKEWLAVGVNVVGGCCGTTPDHLAMIRSEITSLIS